VLAEEEGVSTFQHFWSDGVFELGASAERFGSSAESMGNFGFR